MPLKLDKIDIAIIKSLLQDGRKSFRQISRETKITTPTVKARFERLVDVGFIRGVIPIFDLNLIDKDEQDNLTQIQNICNDIIKKQDCHLQLQQQNVTIHFLETETDKIKKSLASEIAIKMVCDYCD